MDSDSFQNPTLRDLAYEIGQVQIYWCFLESEMRRVMKEAGQKDRLSKGTILSNWRRCLDDLNDTELSAVRSFTDKLEMLAHFRNLLAHGIQSVAADPWQENSAYVVCKAPDGTKHTITIDMLRQLAKDIDELRLSLRTSNVTLR